MEFLKIAYTILEIYPKGQKSSSESNSDDELNENSHWIQVSSSLIESNPDILQGDLDEFKAKISELFDKFYQIIKTDIESKYTESHKKIMKEFDENVANSDSYTFDINGVNNFFKKYSELMEQHKTIVSNMINIVSIKNYFKTYIPNTSEMVFVTFEF